MKEGKYTVDAAGADMMPDLTGLSCRWTPVSQDGRRIVSLILEPMEGQTEIPKSALDALFDFLGSDDTATSPMPNSDPKRVGITFTAPMRALGHTVSSLCGP